MIVMMTLELGLITPLQARQLSVNYGRREVM